MARAARPSQNRRPEVDGRAQHEDWLSLVQRDGTFLTLPVLLRAWPTLDALSGEERAALREAHDLAERKPRAWIEFVVEELLGWAGLVTWGPRSCAWTEPRHGIAVDADFAWCHPEALGSGSAHVTPDHTYLLGYVVDPGDDPRGRPAGDDWPLARTDRAAAACRALGVPFALVTNGRLWSLVWAPRGGVTQVASFDTVTWAEAADLVVVRAFVSLLRRNRFTAVADDQRLETLLVESAEAQEEITETLGLQVRRAVEQLVESMGRWDAREAAVGRAGLGDVDPHEVYGGAVSTLMRLMFLFYAEERGLLPADEQVYAAGYSASALCGRLEADSAEVGEEGLEHRYGAWLQLLATAAAVHQGVQTPHLTLPAYDGSLFDPTTHSWLRRVQLDDRTVLRVLQAVQYVVIRRERRRITFRTLEVEQIGYVYEGLLAYDASRSDHWVLGLVGKAGLEEEVPLPELERAIADHTDLETGRFDHAGLAGRLAERYKESGVGTAKKLTGLLAPPAGADRTSRLQRLLAVTDGDRSLAERILPLSGLLRDDLRGLPLVVPAGSLYVTSSRERAKSGAHYTPRKLAEQVTGTALQPLLYRSPGPLDTDDERAWVPASAAELLTLKVVDIAMGSGAFLVAACRYLGAALIEAWAREGDQEARDHLAARGEVGSGAQIDGVLSPVEVRARRTVIEHCLYGVDVNPMAVEMAKLSLWLVSMDPARPFTFLDGHLVSGDSLLGMNAIEQIEALHVLPDRGRAKHRKFAKDPTAGVRGLVADLARARESVTAMPGDTAADLDAKRARLAEAERYSWRTELIGDLVTGAGLVGATKGPKAMDDVSDRVALHAEELDGSPADGESARKAQADVARWLGTDRPAEGDERRPLHWPLRFPEVWTERGGFDAVIGNPPFLGGKKITGMLGTAYRDYLLQTVGRGTRGNADLVAYFVLRAHQLLNDRGQTGLIATNTLAQGDTREVALDQLDADGVIMRAAIKSERWPARSAVLQFCAVWTSKAAVATSVPRVLDEVPVRRITATLDPGSRATGTPHRLAANADLAFIGSYVLGMGFTMTPGRAQQLIEADGRNAEVLFPYLNGQDLNTRPDCSASRWVVNFRNWSEERARSYAVPFAQIEAEVRPERRRLKPDGDFALRTPLPQRYWLYADKRPALYTRLAMLPRAIAITLVSKVVMPVLAPTGQVFSHALGVFATDSTATFALLSSASHYWWAIERASTLETRVRYTPTDVFETFARPEREGDLQHLGERLDDDRRALMLARQAGLTATYNLVHDPGCADADIVGLRETHQELDHAVFAAYGWTDLSPVHDHYETRQGVRWTIDPSTRQEMLDRLLELNHARWAAEQGVAPASDDHGSLF